MVANKDWQLSEQTCYRTAIQNYRAIADPVHTATMVPSRQLISIERKIGMRPARLTHLQYLEAENIHIMREVAAQCHNPVMLYSIGKDTL